MICVSNFFRNKTHQRQHYLPRYQKLPKSRMKAFVRPSKWPVCTSTRGYDRRALSTEMEKLRILQLRRFVGYIFFIFLFFKGRTTRFIGCEGDVCGNVACSTATTISTWNVRALNSNLKPTKFGCVKGAMLTFSLEHQDAYFCYFLSLRNIYTHVLSLGPTQVLYDQNLNCYINSSLCIKMCVFIRTFRLSPLNSDCRRYLTVPRCYYEIYINNVFYFEN